LDGGKGDEKKEQEVIGNWDYGGDVLARGALLRQARKCKTVRREILTLKEKIKEISIPFVLYDDRCYTCCNC